MSRSFSINRQWKIDEFADLLNYHWELSRKVDAGSTNTLIDQIFLSIEDLIDAKMVCGAGGGGFLQVILKKGVQKADVHKRLKDVFQDNPVDVWDCEIICSQILCGDICGIYQRKTSEKRKNFVCG